MPSLGVRSPWYINKREIRVHGKIFPLGEWNEAYDLKKLVTIVFPQIVSSAKIQFISKKWNIVSTIWMGYNFKIKKKASSLE